MNRVRCRAVVLLVAALLLLVATAPTAGLAEAKITNVDFIVDRATNRRVGYIITRMRPIESRIDANVTIADVDRNSTKANTTTTTVATIDRDAPAEEGYEHEGEMVLVDQIPDTQAVETIQHEGEHHHHHHHSEGEKVITLVKNVPEFYPIEKNVHVPIYKEVPYFREIPAPEPYPVIREVPYPVKVIVKVPVKIPAPYPVIKESYYPVPVHIDRLVPHHTFVPKPYPVERPQYYEVKIPKVEPFPLERKVPVLYQKPEFILQPHPVDKVVPYPVKVIEERPRPVFVPEHEDFHPSPDVKPIYENQERAEYEYPGVGLSEGEGETSEDKKDDDSGDDGKDASKPISTEAPKTEKKPGGSEKKPASNEPAKVREDKSK